MSDEALDRFGEMLVRALHDGALQHFDMLAKHRYLAASFKSLQDGLVSLTEEQRSLVRSCVMSALECAIDAFLQSIEDEGISIAGRSRESDIDLVSRMFGKDGWIVRFSEFPPKS